jgi:erythronate-4-phosphate dehydrogenase
MDADALIVRTRTKCNADLLEGSKVKFIATATIGYDHIDISYCHEKGITWANAAGCNSGSVMQYVASALLTYAEENKIDLSNRVLGIIGAGNVGKKVIRMAESLGMGIVINDPPRSRSEGHCGFVSMEGILREADIVSLHVPLYHEGQDRTYHLIDTGFFEKINKGTLLINTSRGEVVDSDAIKKALISGKLSDAILDVWENEPKIDRVLQNAVFLGTPHIAGYSIDGKANATTIVVNALSKYFNLGIDGWESFGLPEPDKKIIYYDALHKSLQKIFFDLVNTIYNIRTDDAALRTEPKSFENYRENYPFRREFGAYNVKVDNLADPDKEAITRFGFNIL